MRELQLLELLTDRPGTSQSALAHAVGLTGARVNAYIRSFLDKGYITTGQRSRGLEYPLTTEGRRCLAYHQVSYRAELVRLSRAANRQFREYFAELRAQNIERIALYGAGETCEVVLEALASSRDVAVSAVLDDDPIKQGSAFHGFAVSAPCCLAVLQVDAVVVTSITFAEQIRSRLAEQPPLVPVYFLTA